MSLSEVIIIAIIVALAWVPQRYILPRLNPRQQLGVSIVASVVMVVLLVSSSEWEESWRIWLLMGVLLAYANLKRYKAWKHTC